jgi:hypothetical protein
LDGLIGNLAASFEAQVARADRIAADDLALALAQDADLYEALSRWRGARVAVEGLPSLQVSALGVDHVAAGDPVELVVSLSHAILRRAPSERKPVRTDHPLSMALRPWSRARCTVRVGAGGSIYEGILVRAGTDHVLLRRENDELLIGYGQLAWVRLYPGG